jgi:hypothetical protein
VPPAIDLNPVQPPDAEQEVALVEPQVSFAAAPAATELGLAVRVTVGAEDFTDTVADCAALPPLPVQVRV